MCPLCSCKECNDFAIVKNRYDRPYLRCDNCDLIFMNRSVTLPPSEEKQRYTQHNNDQVNPGYTRFLKTLLDPVIKLSNKEASGLDFGSGPYPMMVKVAEMEGIHLDYYDPYFAPDNTGVLSKKYDFLLCCEVAEHFNEPAKDIDFMISLLKPEGILGIKTSRFDDTREFAKWHYVQDETHISIYTDKTIQWIADRWSLKVAFMQKDVVIFKVP